MLVYICSHVLKHERQVSLVVHHSDEMWQLTCGGYDHPDDHPDLHPVHLAHLVQAQPSLEAIVRAVEKGHLAELVDGEWRTMAHDD